jgi:hypothetical protein
MKTRGTKSPVATKRFRTINLHARFTPDGLDADGRLAFANFLAAATKRTRELHPEGLSETEVRLLKQKEWLVNAHGAIIDGLSVMADAAAKGDEDAAKSLAQVAIHAAGLLLFTEKAKPELLRSVARGQPNWPVLASEEAGWEKRVVQRIADLQLGEELRWYKVRFRKARGVDANLPARRWAKAAVRAIEETRFRYLTYGTLLRNFGTTEALCDFCDASGWEFGRQPKWISEIVKLKPLKTESLPAWKSAIRSMIREQLSDFHTRPEWATQRNSAAARGRSTSGEIQNAILDDICSALERIAPIKEMPKSAC